MSETTAPLRGRAVSAEGGLVTSAPPSNEPTRVIASLARDQENLELKTVDLCFLAGLYLRADKAALASFEEDVLIDMFEQVCDVVEPGAENPRKRATHAIQRLREQSMLARVDGAGIVRAGDYALTTLAAAVVQSFLTDEALTRESLTLLTGGLSVQLAEVLAAAKKATDTETSKSKVSGPLCVTVSELVSGIERRQRGLDAQQEEVQAEIAKLLQSDWFSAVDRCQLLLDITTSTLNELNEILLRDTHLFVALLLALQGLATAAENREAEETVQRVIEHVDRIASWGSARQQAWSEYYQYVHRYLRDVVRLRPPQGLVALTPQGRVDLAAVLAVLGEVSIPERALRGGLALEGAILAALLVENLGAFCDLHAVDGWLLVHVPEWDTATVARLLERLVHVPVVHFGDLDPNGVRILRHLRALRSDLRGSCRSSGPSPSMRRVCRVSGPRTSISAKLLLSCGRSRAAVCGSSRNLSRSTRGHRRR
ncbi:hypothetical protein D7Y11_21070 [Corallococcus sp. AB018]|uniref:Wadjet anti-phage system protein JetD domain-containing protein n=1 Tax=Corallococcus sp. AB018 TaxID=2316715 RepID=UPI000F8766C9|nr:Wadjet anti-phage system protein JetD domain-containing protein [Corallococcus sp. AB018]RUO91236.1 hypothetical protein D7Y11_21070 [Corallococcus sp. AB018]